MKLYEAVMLDLPVRREPEHGPASGFRPARAGAQDRPLAPGEHFVTEWATHPGHAGSQPDAAA